MPMSRTSSGGVKAADGVLYISKTNQSSANRKKLRAMITFVPRLSHFDTNNTSSGVNEFRGFFTLFWISMFLLVVQNYVRSFEMRGYPIELAFAAMFSRDAKVLAISDAVLVLSTALSVPFVKAIQKGWIRYYWTGVVLQHSFQTIVLVAAIGWTFNRQWPWVQSGFFTLHTFVMIMKMHSYMSINGYLHHVHCEYEATLESLRTAATNFSGWERAVADAKTAIAALSNPDTPGEGSQGETVRSYVDGEIAAAIRNRMNTKPVEDEATSGRPEKHQPLESDEIPEAHLLAHHPRESISEPAKYLIELDSELTSTGVKRVRWPQNISLWNFADYQMIPTLVYELEYPRTNSIRPLYVIEKVTATFGTFALLYTIAENFIIPLTPTKEQSFLRSLLDLALPFMVAYLLLFYIIFECICNGFAELSQFADRGFYEDWWNSTSWDEFSRKWNKPVYSFLLRHVYGPTLAHYKISRTLAMFVTFFLSAAVHELVMAIVTKKIRMYLFTLQLIQIPLIAFSRLPAVKKNKALGNVVFWIGLYMGFPMLCVAYCAY